LSAGRNSCQPPDRKWVKCFALEVHTCVGLWIVFPYLAKRQTKWWIARRVPSYILQEVLLIIWTR
jgi:hypothetical protein